MSTRLVVPVLLHFYLLIWFARDERVIVIWLEQYSVQKVDTANDLVDLAYVNAFLSPHEHLDHLVPYLEAFKLALRTQINLDAVGERDDSRHVDRVLPHRVAHHVHVRGGHADYIFSR